MKRADFLRAVGAVLPFAAFARSLSGEQPAKSEPIEAPRYNHEMHRRLDSLAFPTLRYHLPEAQVVRLPDTGDARKWLVQMKGRSGRWVSKEATLSGAVIAVGVGGYNRAGRASESAYQICKKAKECARDLAHMEGIDWRRNEHTWPAEAHLYRDHSRRYDRV